ncbi:hypothetical protein SSYM_1761, partial [Serratia symbiotica str. Tucson]
SFQRLASSKFTCLRDWSEHIKNRQIHHLNYSLLNPCCLRSTLTLSCCITDDRFHHTLYLGGPVIKYDLSCALKATGINSSTPCQYTLQKCVAGCVAIRKPALFRGGLVGAW